METASHDVSASRPDRDVYTVSRLNREARVLLERGFGSLWLEGEISNFARPASGHWYFSLKDAAAQVRCAMFRQRNLLLGFAPRDGQKVLVRARVGLYETRGEYQLLVEHMEDAGQGAMRRQFDELAARLAAEGLFDVARKRPLPRLARRIGVITSPSGAAVRDVIHVLARRFPAARVLIYPVPVQGSQAAPEIIAALLLAARRAECDVLILARGGGSLEDLWAFNDEALARAIAASPIPIVSGVGHEIDFTIADFAADVRAPTPSAAAEIVVPDAQEWLNAFRALEERVRQSVRRRLNEGRERLRWLTGRAQIASPTARLGQQMQRLDDLEQRCGRALRGRFIERRGDLGALQTRLWRASPVARLRESAGRHAALVGRLATAELTQLRRKADQLCPLERTLQAVSPLATLERGYAIVSGAGGDILRDAAKASRGSIIEARLARGRIRAKVEDSST